MTRKSSQITTWPIIGLLLLFSVALLLIWIKAKQEHELLFISFECLRLNEKSEIVALIHLSNDRGVRVMSTSSNSIIATAQFFPLHNPWIIIMEFQDQQLLSIRFRSQDDINARPNRAPKDLVLTH